MKAMTSTLKQALLYGSSIALMKGISLLMLPFITHQLPAAEFGKLEIISSIAALGSILVGLGLEDTLYRFVGACKNNDPDQQKAARKKIAAQIFTLTLFIGAFLLPLGWFLAGFLGDALPAGLTSYQLRLVLMMLALEGCIAVPLGWLRMQNYAATFFYAAVGRAFLQASLTVFMLFMGRGIDGVLEAGLIAAILQCALLSALQIKDTGLSMSSTLTKKALIYSLPIMASGIMAFSMNGLDRWVLAKITSLETLAQFGIAAKFALGLVLLLQPFGMWWMPKRFDVLYGENGHEKAAKITCYGISGAMILAVIVGISAPVAIDVLFPPSYAPAAQFVTFLIAATLFKEMAELINLGSYAGETSYVQMGINAISAVTAFFSLWFLGDAFGVMGVIFALVFAQGLRLVLFFAASQRLCPLPYPVFNILVSTLFCLFWLATAQLEWTLIERLALLFIAPLSLGLLSQKLKLLPSFSFMLKARA